MSLRRGIFYIFSVVVVGVLGFAFTSCQKDRGRDTQIVAVPVGDEDISTKSRSKTSTSKSRRASRAGGGDCEGEDDCEDQCKDLFSSNSKREDCEELSVNEVDGMFIAFEEDDGYLAEPDDDDLEEIHPEDIENALDIDDRVWTDLIKEYSSAEAEDVLYWIATEEDIYDAIDSSLDKDDLENFFKDLLKELNINTFTDFINKSLDKDDEDNFLVLAYNADESESAASFIIERANDDCIKSAAPTNQNKYNSITGDDDRKKGACLLGEVLCREDGGDHIYEDVFEFVVEDISALEDYIEKGSASTGTTGYRDGLGEEDDSDDIDDVCAAAVAQGLPVRR